MKQLVWITTVRQQANRGLKCVTIKNYSCLKQTQTTFAGSVPGNLPSKSLKCRSQAAVPRANKEVTNAPAVHKGPTRAVCFLQPNVLPRSFHGSMKKEPNLHSIFLQMDRTDIQQGSPKNIPDKACGHSDCPSPALGIGCAGCGLILLPSAMISS